MNSRDYSRIAHAINMSRNDTHEQQAVDMVAVRIADMLLASDGSYWFDRASFLDSCEVPTKVVVDDDIDVEWTPTHQSLTDGSEVMDVSDDGYGDRSRVFLAMNENGDVNEYLTSEWGVITP
jgi:hypothetical protein